MTETVGERIAARSASEYGDYLHGLLSSPRSAALIRAVDNLIATLDVALKRREGLTVTDLRFSCNDLARLGSSEWPMLVNQSVLGSGTETSPTIVMGTEEAYDLSRMGLWNCAAAVLRLCGSKPEVLRSLASGMVAENWDRLPSVGLAEMPPFHQYAAPTLLALGQTIGQGSTWAYLSRVLNTPNIEALGGHCYELDRSAHAAKEAQKGQPPSEERLRFLGWALEQLHPTARLLLIHGHISWPDPGWETDRWLLANRRLSTAFLGCDHLPEPVDVARRPAGWIIVRFASGKRTVLWTWALNGRNPQVRENLGLVAELIRQGLS